MFHGKKRKRFRGEHTKSGRGSSKEHSEARNSSQKEAKGGKSAGRARGVVHNSEKPDTDKSLDGFLAEARLRSSPKLMRRGVRRLSGGEDRSRSRKGVGTGRDPKEPTNQQLSCHVEDARLNLISFFCVRSTRVALSWRTTAAEHKSHFSCRPLASRAPNRCS
jgi:hypothetical protein